MKILELKPKDETANINIGLCYSQGGLTDKAIYHYNQTVKINPKNIYAHYNLGMAYFYEEQYKKAISEYEKVIELDAKNFSAYYNMGLAYNNIDKKKAKQIWIKYINLAKEDKSQKVWVKKARKYLKNAKFKD